MDPFLKVERDVRRQFRRLETTLLAAIIFHAKKQLELGCNFRHCCTTHSFPMTMLKVKWHGSRSFLKALRRSDEAREVNTNSEERNAVLQSFLFNLISWKSGASRCKYLGFNILLLFVDDKISTRFKSHCLMERLFFVLGLCKASCTKVPLGTT